MYIYILKHHKTNHMGPSSLGYIKHFCKSQGMFQVEVIHKALPQRVLAGDIWLCPTVVFLS